MELEVLRDSYGSDRGWGLNRLNSVILTGAGSVLLTDFFQLENAGSDPVMSSNQSETGIGASHVQGWPDDLKFTWEILFQGQSDKHNYGLFHKNRWVTQHTRTYLHSIYIVCYKKTVFPHNLR